MELDAQVWLTSTCGICSADFFYFVWIRHKHSYSLFVCLFSHRQTDITCASSSSSSEQENSFPMTTEPRRAPPCEILSAFNETFSSTIIRLLLNKSAPLFGESEPGEFIRKSIHRKTSEISLYYSEYEVRGTIPDWFWCRLTDRDKTAAYYLDKRNKMSNQRWLAFSKKCENLNWCHLWVCVALADTCRGFASQITTLKKKKKKGWTAFRRFWPRGWNCDLILWNTPNTHKRARQCTIMAVSAEEPGVDCGVVRAAEMMQRRAEGSQLSYK